MKYDLKEAVVCVVGLGYVGLPLATEFSQHFNKVISLSARLSTSGYTKRPENQGD